MLGRQCCDGMRVFASTLVVGVLFAGLAGLQAGQSSDGNGTGTSVRTSFGFAPVAALVGFVGGGLVGMLVAALWARPGAAGVVGIILVVAIGGLLGLAVAALVGAESRTFVEGNAIGTEYGAPRPVLAAGAAVGAVAGALAAWLFRPGHATRPAGVV